MTIDEAINDFKKMAENARGDIIDGSNLEPQEKHYNSQLELYVKEKEQIADWLEELKELRATSCGYSKEDIELNRNAMYNKAINDFVNKIISLCWDGEFMARLNEFTATTILELAEELKAGD